MFLTQLIAHPVVLPFPSWSRGFESFFAQTFAALKICSLAWIRAILDNFASGGSLQKTTLTLNISKVFELKRTYYRNFKENSFFGTKTNLGCNDSSFFGHIMKTIYVFVYEKINQNRVMSGSTQYSKRKIFVMVPKKLVSWIIPIISAL